ncbi:MAG: hypothetical protein ACI97B_001522 [Verrucomicrobiales bacterium]|jgi:hypothetical protein
MNGDALYDAKTHLAGPTLQSADYAIQLFQRGGESDIARALNVVKALIQLQVDDPSARTHGQFPFHPGGEAQDLNAALFIMPQLMQLLKCGRECMPKELAGDFDACVQRATLASERRWTEERFDLHRDFKGYTNIFLLYIQAILLAGEHYGDERLLRQATAQWQRWFNHVSYYGIDEFASPTYSNIDYGVLKTICETTRDNQMRRESKHVLDHLSALLHGITHPVLRLPVCGSSRDYRGFLKPGNHEAACVREGEDSPYTSKSVRDDYTKRSFPYSVQGRATTVPFRFQSWQDSNAAMGSMTGGNYYWQQIHCMVAVGKNEHERAVLFAPGAYTPTSGFVCQHEHTALCLFSRKPNSFHRTQEPMPDAQVHAYQGAFGIGMTRNWEMAQHACGSIVLSAYGYEVLIQPFEIRNGTATPISLPRTKQNDMSQGRFHKTAADFDALMFPDDAVCFGCRVSVQRGTVSRVSSDIHVTEQDNVMTVDAGNGLRVRIFQHPSGELTELYEDDWRTQPLLETPVHRLNPGDLTHLAAEASAGDEEVQAHLVVSVKLGVPSM